jgi:HEAT repeat protein
MNKVAARVAVAAGILLLAAMMVQTLRSRRTPPLVAPRLDVPVPPPVIAPVETPRTPTPGKAAQAPERLLPLLEKLGRARLVRDRRTLAELRRRVEPIHEEDFEWIRGRLSEELLTAAGAAELVVAFGRMDAVGDLASVLAKSTSTLLKDVAIEALATLGGDGAVSALVTAARGDADEGVRARAASALGGFTGPEAYTTLTAALRDPSALVRSASATALLRLPSRDAVDALIWALAAETDPRIQADLAVAAYSMSGDTKRVDVVQAMLARPALLSVLEQRRRVKDDSRYRQPYDRAFFEAGQRTVDRPTGARQIGITIETGPTLTLGEAAARLFAAAPLDRYRDWFRLRKAEEFPAARVYDSYGQPAGDVPYDDLDGTVFLRFRDPKSFDPGVLGYTKGCEAFVSDASLLHEFGHAFARLGDEYPEGTAVDAPNLAHQSPPAWERLITGAMLPEPVRRDKSYLVPSADCHMANRPSPTRFCPVCQLEIHARMWELSGAPLPW